MFLEFVTNEWERYMGDQGPRVNWYFYGLTSVTAQLYLWGFAWLIVWLGWDALLADWLKAEHVVQRNGGFFYLVAKVLTAIHIIVTIALLLRQLYLNRRMT